jgi:hypothetical protein
MYGWNERPTKATALHHIGGDTPATVYEIGRYRVTVPGDERAVTYTVDYHEATDPRKVLPNMVIADGNIRIPVDDLVGAALARLEPVEIARALWQDADVKAEFIDCMSERWTQGGVDDGDRRKLLQKIKEAVHSVALDKLANAMAKAEYEISRRAHFYDEVRRINETLRELDVRIQRTRRQDDGSFTAESVVLQFDERDRGSDGDLAVGGRSWTEAREYWRGEMLRTHFPAPTDADSPSEEASS